METGLLMTDFFVALLVALALGGLFVWGTRKEGRDGLLWLFLLILLGTWAGGIWLRPFGPVLLGVHWLTFIAAGAIVVLLLTVTGPREARRRPQGRHDTLDMLEQIEEEKARRRVTYVTVGVVFWFLVAVLVTVILLRYLF